MTEDAMQLAATILFFLVFILLFIALVLYIGTSIYRLFQEGKRTPPPHHH